MLGRPKVKDWTCIGVDVSDSLETARVVLAGLVDGGGRGIVDALGPMPAATAAAEVDRLCREHPVELVVVWPGGNAVNLATELRAVRPYETRELSGVEHDVAVVRFSQWSMSGRLLHAGSRDLTAAARDAKITRGVSGLLRVVRRGSTVDLAVLGAAQCAAWGLPADLSGEGLGPDDVHVGWESSRRDPAELPPHLAEQARLIELGIQPQMPNWPGAR